MIWRKLLLLNILTPPLASLTLVVIVALFDREWSTSVLQDVGGIVLGTVLHLLGTLLVATPSAVLILQKAPSGLAYLCRLSLIGSVGGALLLLWSPLFGAFAGLNAALIWCGLSIGLFGVPRSSGVVHG